LIPTFSREKNPTEVIVILGKAGIQRAVKCIIWLPSRRLVTRGML
jgi:hypothetical protein